MSNLRDEISKIVDMRIPKGGYRRYLYEIDRTGGFNMKTVLDMLIAISEKIDELEAQLEAVKDMPQMHAHTPTAMVGDINLQDYKVSTGSTHPAPEDLPEQFVCPVCDKKFASKLALTGHSRSHNDGKTTDSTKHRA